jgi:hypothetical protein
MRIVTITLILLALVASGCGGASNPAAGPNYSTTSCADNCGNDAQCMSSCQEVGGPNSPPPIHNGK